MTLATEAIQAAARAAREAGGLGQPALVEVPLGGARVRFHIIAPFTSDTLATSRPHLRRAYPQADLEVLRAFKAGEMSEAQVRHELQILAVRAADAAADPVLQHAEILAAVRGWDVEQPDGTWLHDDGRVVDRPEDCPAGLAWLLLDDLRALPVELAPGIVVSVADRLSSEIHRLAAARNGRVAASFASFRTAREGADRPAGPSVRGDSDGRPAVGSR